VCHLKTAALVQKRAIENVKQVLRDLFMNREQVHPEGQRTGEDWGKEDKTPPGLYGNTPAESTPLGTCAKKTTAPSGKVKRKKVGRRKGGAGGSLGENTKKPTNWEKGPGGSSTWRGHPKKKGPQNGGKKLATLGVKQR